MPQPRDQAIDHVLTLVAQAHAARLRTDPVDFVEFLLAGVSYRDLDQVADDIVCFVLHWDDLTQHVRDRLDVARAFTEAGQPRDARRAASDIVAAIRALVGARLKGGL